MAENAIGFVDDVETTKDICLFMIIQRTCIHTMRITQRHTFPQRDPSLNVTSIRSDSGALKVLTKEGL